MESGFCWAFEIEPRRVFKDNYPCYFRSMTEIYHTIGIPLLFGLALSMLKLIAESKSVTFDEANGTALDLVLVSVGALCAFYYRGRSSGANSGAAAGDLVLAVLLLLIRAGRTRDRAKLSPGVQPAEVSWYVGCFELLLGVLSVVWTVKAF